MKFMAFLFLHIKDRTSSNTTKWLHIALFGLVDWMELAVGFHVIHLYVYKYRYYRYIDKYKFKETFAISCSSVPDTCYWKEIASGHPGLPTWSGMTFPWSLKPEGNYHTKTLSEASGISLKFPLTSRVSNFFKRNIWMSEYTGLIMSQKSIAWYTELPAVGHATI